MAGALPPMRQSGLRVLNTPQGERLDRALVLPFARGASFTDEDVAELMVHGSVATIVAVERCLAEDHGLRMAAPGEFTRRALDNGVMDLTQVEALGDLLDAETESQRRQAQRVLDGALGRMVDEWRDRLVRAAALVEAEIDFADEQLGSFDAQILAELQAVRTSLGAEIAGQSARERVQTGFEVALVGSVNTGKSTLLNALAGRDAAITSDTAGTTRDVVEVRMDIGGYAVTILDTAGLRVAADPVEEMGINRGQARAAAADFRIILIEGPDAAPPVTPAQQDIVVHGKADLHPQVFGGVSGQTGVGIDGLLEQVMARLQAMTAHDGVTVRRRHRQAMQQAELALADAIEKQRDPAYGPELVAADIRRCTGALDMLVGRIDVEDVLGDIFSSFCIGK